MLWGLQAEQGGIRTTRRVLRAEHPVKPTLPALLARARAAGVRRKAQKHRPRRRPLHPRRGAGNQRGFEKSRLRGVDRSDDVRNSHIALRPSLGQPAAPRDVRAAEHRAGVLQAHAAQPEWLGRGSQEGDASDNQGRFTLPPRREPPALGPAAGASHQTFLAPPLQHVSHGVRLLWSISKDRSAPEFDLACPAACVSLEQVRGSLRPAARR